MKKDQIFYLPKLVLDKLNREQFLDMLRTRVNKHYMPSARSKMRHNPTPYYQTNSLKDYSHIPEMNEGTGFYAFSGSASGSPIYLNVEIDNFQIVVNLRTDSVMVRIMDISRYPVLTDEFIPWTSQVQGLPIDPRAMQEHLDEFL